MQSICELVLRKRGKNSHIKTPIIPIYTYDFIRTLTINKRLYDEGVYANSSVPPATPPNECLIRTSVMATHAKPLIDEATDIIAKVIKES